MSNKAPQRWSDADEPRQPDSMGQENRGEITVVDPRMSHFLVQFLARHHPSPNSSQEQFSTEWMYCTPRSRGGLETTQVAGQYGWKTHLYAISHIMWSLISHRRQPRAPVPWKIRVRFAPPPGAPVPVYPDPAPAPTKKRKSRARDPWQKPKPKRPRYNLEPPPPDPNTTLGAHEEFQWSYGGYLLQHDDDPAFSRVDRELRELVVRCMMELPRDRPELQELDAIFKAKLGPSPLPGGDGGGLPPSGGPPPGGPPPDDDDDDDSDDGPPSGAPPPAHARPVFVQRVFRDPPAPVHYDNDSLSAVRVSFLFVAGS